MRVFLLKSRYSDYSDDKRWCRSYQDILASFRYMGKNYKHSGHLGLGQWSGLVSRRQLSHVRKRVLPLEARSRHLTRLSHFLSLTLQGEDGVSVDHDAQLEDQLGGRLQEGFQEAEHGDVSALKH